MRFTARLMAGVCAVLMLSATAGLATVLYVNTAATGSNNGSSWDDAFTTLPPALTAAASGDEIWVAAGTYKPATASDRTVSIAMKNGVGVYGGFAGTETQRSQRDPAATRHDPLGRHRRAGVANDNSYHVVTASASVTVTGVLDGFTITDGQADGAPASNNDRGAGLWDNGGSPTLVAPDLHGQLRAGRGRRPAGHQRLAAAPLVPLPGQLGRIRRQRRRGLRRRRQLPDRAELRLSLQLDLELLDGRRRLRDLRRGGDADQQHLRAEQPERPAGRLRRRQRHRQLHVHEQRRLRRRVSEQQREHDHQHHPLGRLHRRDLHDGVLRLRAVTYSDVQGGARGHRQRQRRPALHPAAERSASGAGLAGRRLRQQRRRAGRRDRGRRRPAPLLRRSGRAGHRRRALGTPYRGHGRLRAHSAGRLRSAEPDGLRGLLRRLLGDGDRPGAAVVSVAQERRGPLGRRLDLGLAHDGADDRPVRDRRRRHLRRRRHRQLHPDAELGSRHPHRQPDADRERHRQRGDLRGRRDAAQRFRRGRLLVDASRRSVATPPAARRAPPRRRRPSTR